MNFLVIALNVLSIFTAGLYSLPTSRPVISKGSSNPSVADLRISNELCVQYFQNNNKNPSNFNHECSITCIKSNGLFGCHSQSPLCVEFAQHVYKYSNGREGVYFCNVLTRQLLADDNQVDYNSMIRLCDSYKQKSKPSQYGYPCKIACHNIFEVTSNNGRYGERFHCESKNNFVGCDSYLQYLTSQHQPLSSGEYSCEIYDHGNNYAYPVRFNNNAAQHPVRTTTNTPQFYSLGLLNSGVGLAQGAVQGTVQGFSNIINRPLQFLNGK